MGERPAGRTPSQTVGPYFTMRLAGEGDNVIVTPETIGRRIKIEGRIYDGDRRPIEDALIEIWQANAAGRYRHPHDRRVDAPIDEAFSGFGRCAVDFHDGSYSFLTVEPGPVPHPDGSWQAPHVSLVVQARGMLRPVFTRMYFADEDAANATDPVLALVPPERRSTLIGVVVDTAAIPTYRFDIRFQGADETVFLDA